MPPETALAIQQQAPGLGQSDDLADVFHTPTATTSASSSEGAQEAGTVEHPHPAFQVEWDWYDPQPQDPE